VTEELQIRICGDSSLPTLVYLPGLHGDWTLIGAFQVALKGRVRFVVVTYPRSLTWSPNDYADAVDLMLQRSGIKTGWLLAESFGSQVAWAILSKSNKFFLVEGLVLAGGFVKHPWKWGPPLVRWLVRHTPKIIGRWLWKIYEAYSRFRHRHSPDALKLIDEFRDRRTDLDLQAMERRLASLDDYDPRPIACQTKLPVYYLAGLVDPLVPWFLVRRWLRLNCPGYRCGKTFLADHNVLATAAAGTADTVVAWMETRKKGCCRRSDVIFES
jgi:pimeloyl-ACP methyl ester carboxylesterase